MRHLSIPAICRPLDQVFDLHMDHGARDMPYHPCMPDCLDTARFGDFFFVGFFWRGGFRLFLLLPLGSGEAGF